MMRLTYKPVRRHAAWRLGAVMVIAAISLGAIAWTSGVLAIASVRLNPEDVSGGTSSIGTVTLDAVAGRILSVTLSSANTSLATVPSSVLFNSRDQSKSFTVQTASGAAGCTEISAQLGSAAPRKALIAVKPSQSTSLALRLSRSPAVGGQNLTGTITLLNQPAGSHVVNLSSSNPSQAAVPASVSVAVTATEAGNIGAATFPITTSATSVTVCPIISARLGSATPTLGGTRIISSGALLKLVSIGG